MGQKVDELREKLKGTYWADKPVAFTKRKLRNRMATQSRLIALKAPDEVLRNGQLLIDESKALLEELRAEEGE